MSTEVTKGAVETVLPWAVQLGAGNVLWLAVVVRWSQTGYNRGYAVAVGVVGAVVALVVIALLLKMPHIITRRIADSPFKSRFTGQINASTCVALFSVRSSPLSNRSTLTMDSAQSVDSCPRLPWPTVFMDVHSRSRPLLFP